MSASKIIDQRLNLSTDLTLGTNFIEITVVHEILASRKFALNSREHVRDRIGVLPGLRMILYEI